MRKEKPKLLTGPQHYQHLNEGGINFSLNTLQFKKRKEVRLVISLSNYGQAVEFQVPMFETSAFILEALAKQIRETGVIDPSYLAPVTTRIYSDDGEELGTYTNKQSTVIEDDPVEDEGQDPFKAGEQQFIDPTLGDNTKKIGEFVTPESMKNAIRLDEATPYNLSLAENPTGLGYDSTEEELNKVMPDMVFEPRVGDIWHMRLGTSVTLSTAEIADLTQLTVSLRVQNSLGVVRWHRKEVVFVERILEGLKGASQ
jgi:hypothetical protein